MAAELLPLPNWGLSPKGTQNVSLFAHPKLKRRFHAKHSHMAQENVPWHNREQSRGHGEPMKNQHSPATWFHPQSQLIKAQRSTDKDRSHMLYYYGAGAMGQEVGKGYCLPTDCTPGT